jgi:hypothetical protein
MFVRSAVREETKPRTREALRTGESTNEALQHLERTRVDFGKSNPFWLLIRTIGPVICAFWLAGVMLSDPALDAIAGQPVPSVAAPAGTVLAKTDTTTRSGNYEITVPGTGDSTLMLVWDYAAEDGDMVGVLVNGDPLGEAFTIYHGARVIRVPANADVQVIGTYDGGGGITYAVNFPEAGKSIVNGIAAGDTNLYRLASQAGSPGAAP